MFWLLIVLIGIKVNVELDIMRAYIEKNYPCVGLEVHHTIELRLCSALHMLPVLCAKPLSFDEHAKWWENLSRVGGCYAGLYG